MAWNIRSKIKKLIEQGLYPLPNPNTEANKFFESSLRCLVWNQIKEIVRLIVDETKKSREFGLYISPAVLEKEELFFLSAINGMGGIWRMRQMVPFEVAQAAVSELMNSHFDTERRFYFEQSKQRGESVYNKYDCHLECLCNRLLQEVYYVPNKEFFTA